MWDLPHFLFLSSFLVSSLPSGRGFPPGGPPLPVPRPSSQDASSPHVGDPLCKPVRPRYPVLRQQCAQCLAPACSKSAGAVLSCSLQRDCLLCPLGPWCALGGQSSMFGLGLPMRSSPPACILQEGGCLKNTLPVTAAIRCFGVHVSWCRMISRG